MDLARMLEKCVRDQWSIDDLDWSLPPPHLPRDKEEAVVQYFIDMAGIELLAGALFEVQRDKTKDPTLKNIFATFVADEKRHSAVASRLSKHYDVHHYKDYVESASLTRFRPHFLKLVREASPEIANAYITSGESTLAREVATELAARGIHAVTLDSDKVRDALPPLGYDAASREAFYTALAKLAALLAQQGHVVLVPATAHRRAFRDAARKLAPAFVEIYVDTPLDECKRRDPKGIYAAGGSDVPGIGVPFEPPPAPDFVSASGAATIAQRISDLTH